MKHIWILALLSPVIGFSSYYYEDDIDEKCAHHEYVVLERLGVCAECGSVLGTVVDRREVAAREDQVERRVSPQRKGQAHASSHSRARSIREKASTRPKVVQKQKDTDIEEMPEKRERYASTTIGSLARKPKQQKESSNGAPRAKTPKNKKQTSYHAQRRERTAAQSEPLGRQELRGRKK